MDIHCFRRKRRLRGMKSEGMEKALKANMLLNAIQGFLSIVFPVITYPYILHILQVENVGKYQFAHSVVSYFMLLAQLGIGTYAIRNGARLRSKQYDISKFCAQILTLNTLTTFAAILLLVIVTFTFAELHKYRTLLFIFSLQIVCQTVGREYVCSVYEDYGYLTIKSIITHMISLLLLFLFVKSENDLIPYAWVSTIASGGANLWNIFYVRERVGFRFAPIKESIAHFKPVLVFFATNLAVTIYAVSDTTMIGLMKGDYEVGIYSVAAKIYALAKTVLASVVTVSIPRLSMLQGTEIRIREAGFLTTAETVFNTMIFWGMPFICGLAMFSEDIIACFGGISYAGAVVSLRVLCIALFFCIVGYFWSNSILYIFSEERFVLLGTSISAVINIALNLLLIPKYGIIAAAATTAISEFITAMLFWVKGRKRFQPRAYGKNMLKVGLGILIMYLIFMMFPDYGGMSFFALLIKALSVFVGYIVIQIITKNEQIISVISFLRRKANK